MIGVREADLEWRQLCHRVPAHRTGWRCSVVPARRRDRRWPPTRPRGRPGAALRSGHVRRGRPRRPGRRRHRWPHRALTGIAGSHPPVRTPSVRVGKAGCIDVICSAGSCGSTASCMNEYSHPTSGRAVVGESGCSPRCTRRYSWRTTPLAHGRPPATRRHRCDPRPPERRPPPRHERSENQETS